jgi:hypothetical protein
MNGFDLLLLGGVLGLLVVVLRPQTVVLPMVVTPQVDGGGGCLLPLALLFLALLALLLLGEKPA